VDELPRLTQLSEEQRAKAVERFRLLQPYLEHGVLLTNLPRRKTFRSDAIARTINDQ
jgi:hypothetical protein